MAGSTNKSRAAAIQSRTAEVCYKKVQNKLSHMFVSMVPQKQICRDKFTHQADKDR